jgi:hypothetical protein
VPDIDIHLDTGAWWVKNVVSLACARPPKRQSPAGRVYPGDRQECCL